MKSASSLPLAEWIEQSRSGSHEAYRRIVEAYQDRIFRFCLGWVGSVEDAEEICQDTFVNAFSALPRYQSTGQFSAWIYRIARNQCHDHHRSRRCKNAAKERPFESRDHDTMLSPFRQPDDNAAGTEELRRLESAIARLPVKLREVVVLCALEGMSYADCASILRCSTRAVEGRLYRARQQLAEWCDNGDGKR